MIISNRRFSRANHEYLEEEEEEETSLYVNNHQWVANSAMSKEEMICRLIASSLCEERRRTCKLKKIVDPDSACMFEKKTTKTKKKRTETQGGYIVFGVFVCVHHPTGLNWLCAGVDYSVHHHHHYHHISRDLHDASKMYRMWCERRRNIMSWHRSAIFEKKNISLLPNLRTNLKEERRKVNSIDCCCSTACFIVQRTMWCWRIESTNEQVMLRAI